MKKIFNLFAIVVILVLGVVVLTGCGNKENNANVNTNDVTNTGDVGEIVEQKADPNAPSLGKVKITKTNDSIVVVSNDNNVLTTFEYKFKNSVLSGISETVKCPTVAIALETYQEIMADSEANTSLVDIKLNGDTITAKATQSAIDDMGSITLDMLYQAQMAGNASRME